MIRLNLLDPSEIPKEKGSVGGSQIPTSIGSSKTMKGMMLGGGVAGLIYVIILIYYFVGVSGSLGKIKREVNANQKMLNDLTPKVKEVQKEQKRLNQLQAEIKEYETFIKSKKNWAAVLNVLSDELPSEVVFEKMNLTNGSLVRKVKTDKGLVTVKESARLLIISVKVSEQAESQVSAFMKKLKRNSYLKDKLLDIKSSGLILRAKEYQTQLSLYFSISDGEGEKK